jgi:hypothetical protein
MQMQERQRLWLVEYAAPYHDEGCTSAAKKYNSGRGCTTLQHDANRALEHRMLV